MAEDVSVHGQDTCAVKKLSHKLFKRLLQKEKRKIKRQLEAEARKQQEIEEQKRLGNDLEYRKKVEAFEAEKEKQEIIQRELNEKLWLEREAKAQEDLKKKQEDEERRRKQKEEQEKAIKLEWERQQAKEKEEKEKKEKATKEKEDVLFRELEKETTSQESFHNPVAPANYGTEKDVVNCSFFLKTGACRFAERCSRHHPRPSSSVTLLIPAMYADIRHIESALDIADRDTGLEFDEQDAYEKFIGFYDDVYPEFQKSGEIVQFKVCCNYEPHLRGNVYVQYTSEEDCQKAFADFNGRWYAGRQLSCEFSPVTNWKSAICGLFDQNRCPRGKNCNFLHVYHNPDEWINQRSGNRGYDRNTKYNRDRDSRHRSLGSSSSVGWVRSRNDKYRNGDRNSRNDDRGYEEKNRKHQRRSRSLSDEEGYRKRRRRRYRSQSKEKNEEDSNEEKWSSPEIGNGSSSKDSKTKGNGTRHRKYRSRSSSPDSNRPSRSRRKSKKHKKHKRHRGTSEKRETSSEENST